VPSRWISLVACYEWQQRNVTSALNSNAQTTLLVLFQTSLLARLNLTELVDVTLQVLEIFVVKVCNVSLVLKNLSHVKILLLAIYPTLPLAGKSSTGSPKAKSNLLR
jgi:hypothetical protein